LLFYAFIVNQCFQNIWSYLTSNNYKKLTKIAYQRRTKC